MKELLVIWEEAIVVMKEGETSIVFLFCLYYDFHLLSLSAHKFSSVLYNRLELLGIRLW